MNAILKQKIVARLRRLAEIASNREQAPANCSADENDFWVYNYANVPDIDVDDLYDYLGGGIWERR